MTMTSNATTPLLATLLLALPIAAAEAKDKVKVGFIGPLTGGVSANGIGGRNSSDLAVRLRNADAKAKYDIRARRARRRMQAERGRAGGDQDGGRPGDHLGGDALLLGRRRSRRSTPITSSACRSWSGARCCPTSPTATSMPEIHRVNGTMINQNEANAELVSKLGYKTFAVIHDTTDYGKGHNQYFSAALAKKGGKILGTFGVTADQQDFTAELTQIKALNPEAIYFGGLTPIGVRIRSQMDKLGIKALFDGTSGIVSDAFIQGLGPLAEGVLAFREGAPVEKLPGGKFFMEKYAAQKYDNPPEAYGPFAFAAMDLILDSIEKVGPDRKKVIAEMAKVKDRDSIVGKITFDDHGQNTVPLITKYVIQDGKFVEWEDSEYASGKRKLPGQK